MLNIVEHLARWDGTSDKSSRYSDMELKVKTLMDAFILIHSKGKDTSEV